MHEHAEPDARAPRGHPGHHRPTGSGKTTTLYSLLSQLNVESVNIMTLEDPVEYPVAMMRQTSVNEAAKMDFVNGIRSMMRQDPDIILVGEVRDKDTAEMAFRAAMTGHQVFTTLHTNSALGAFPRLLDIGILPDIIAGNVIGIIAQRLVRLLCTHCKEAYVPSREERQILGLRRRTRTSRSTGRPAASIAISAATAGAPRSWRSCAWMPISTSWWRAAPPHSEIRNAGAGKGLQAAGRGGHRPHPRRQHQHRRGGALGGSDPALPLSSRATLRRTASRRDPAMPAFQYKAIDRLGPPRARQARRGQRGRPRAAPQAHGAGPHHVPDRARRRRPRFAKGSVTRRDLITFCFDLEQISRSGIPLIEGLRDLRDGIENPRFREMLSSVLEDIEGGKMLSQGLAAFPQVFSPVFVSLVRAGEQTGRLVEVFESLGKALKWQDELVSQTRKLLHVSRVGPGGGDWPW